MFENFSEVIDRARALGPFIISVAVAQDPEVLRVIRIAKDLGIVEAVLVGDEPEISRMMEDVGLTDCRIVHEADEAEASLKAVTLVKQGEAQVLMKGFVNTSIFMKAVLNKEFGLRSGRLISHMATYEIPGHEKLIFCSDSGINVAPTLEQKQDILTNALLALNAIGLKYPKVAVLAANELVSPSMQATVDAKALEDLNNQGVFPPCILEGPIAMDIACDPEAARHKGIESRVSGDVDLFLFPTIEAGNILGKSWLYFNKAKWAGIVLGASHPVVLGSRSDTAEIKLNSIALACLASQI